MCGTGASLQLDAFGADGQGGVLYISYRGTHCSSSVTVLSKRASWIANFMEEATSMVGFRLLSLEYRSVDRRSSAQIEEGAFERELVISPPPDTSSTEESWTSVVLGRNGLGKSRALGGVAAMFANARYGQLPRERRSYTRSSNRTVWRIRYVLREDECELVGVEGGEIVGRLNGESVPSGIIPLPSRVIALSTTVMDKFPLPPRLSLEDDLEADRFYSYMGLRDRTGRASPTGAVHRALESLMDAAESSRERRSRVADVFQFLGYEPWVEHAYDWRHPGLRSGGKSVRELIDDSEARRAGTYSGERLRRIWDKDPEAAKSLDAIIEKLRFDSEDRYLRFVLDFEQDASTDRSRSRDIQLLRQAGLIRLRSAELQVVEGKTRIDLREISSGELSLVTAFLGIAAVIRDDALVLIDEPEVSLHPEWQAQYLGLLSEVFAKYSGCHFVVATHSPLVVSDVPSATANVLSADPQRPVASPGHEFSGDSIDEVLVRAFDVPGKNNLFLKQLLVESLRIAADGESDTERFAELLNVLGPLASKLEEGSPMRDLIYGLVELREGGEGQS